MSDVKILVRRDVLSHLTRQRALVVLTALFVALLLLCNGVIGAGVSRYAQTIQYQSALNLIELSSTAASARQELTDQTLAPVASMPGVVGVHPWFQVDLALSDDTDWPQPDLNPGSLWATTVVPGLVPPVLLGAIPPEGLSGNQIALPHTVEGGDLDRLVGKTVTMEYTKVTGQGQGEPVRKRFSVVAIVDNSTPGEAGPQASYLNPGTAAELARSSGAAGGSALVYSNAYVQVAEPSLVPAVQSELSAQGFAVSSVGEQLRSLSGLFRVLGLAGWISGVLLLLVCLAVGGAMGSAWIRQRTRELGLLKAIGWSGRRILSALMLELAAVGAAAAVGGVVLGVLASLAGTTVISGLKLDLLPVDPWGLPSLGLLAAAVVAVPLCVALGGLRSALRAVRIDADDALRDL